MPSCNFHSSDQLAIFQLHSVSATKLKWPHLPAGAFCIARLAMHSSSQVPQVPFLFLQSQPVRGHTCHRYFLLLRSSSPCFGQSLSCKELFHENFLQKIPIIKSWAESMTMLWNHFSRSKLWETNWKSCSHAHGQHQVFGDLSATHQWIFGLNS